MTTAERMPWWAWTWPVVAWVVLLSALLVGLGGLLAAVTGIILIATVFAAVYHAEVVAHRVGGPFGTLVLAIAVTVIEVALIVSVMVTAPAEKAGLARDTVFAAVMIVVNGIVGLCLLWAARAITNRDFSSRGPAPPWPSWRHSPRSPWSCRTSWRAYPVQHSARRSLSSPRSSR